MATCFDCGDGTQCHMNCGPVLVNVECRFCWGAGKIHSGRNGDPWDKGQNCPKCGGAGVVQEDCNDFVPEFDDDE